MKKTILFLVITMCFCNTYSQQHLLDLKAKKVSADAGINDTEKGKKTKTWISRSDAYLDIYLMKHISIGTPTKENSLQGIFEGVENIIGKPLSVKTEDTTEIWHYDYVDVYFYNGKVVKWTENNPVEPDALRLAFESYKKAIELDPKIVDKSSTKKGLAQIRTWYYNRALNYREQGLDQQALSDINKCFELNKYPKELKDNTFDESKIKEIFKIE